jgi:hypothetical protein
VLHDADVPRESQVALIVDVAPAQGKQIADAQGGAGAQDDQRVVSILAAGEEIVGQGPQAPLLRMGSDAAMRYTPLL